MAILRYCKKCGTQYYTGFNCMVCTQAKYKKIKDKLSEDMGY
jgi:hypothetical protein